MNTGKILGNTTTNQKIAHIFFIFLSAKTDRFSKIEGLSKGAVDYIDKPFHIDELKKKAVSSLLNFEKQRVVIVNGAYKSMLASSSDNEKVLHSSNDIFLLFIEFSAKEDGYIILYF